MDWDAKEKERREKVEQERKKYRAMSEAEASSLSHQEYYTWIRYEQERLAAEYLDEIQRKLPTQPIEQPKTQRRWASGQTVKVYKKWED